MPDIDFRILGVEPAAHGLLPLLHFKLQVVEKVCPPESVGMTEAAQQRRPATEKLPPSANIALAETIQAVLLHVQIQLQPAQRAYKAAERERLLELFGAPERWGQTLRNRLWTHAHATVPAFRGSVEVTLPVPCTYDLNVAAAKYFYALEEGEVSLLFLFSGTIFYSAADGRLQVQQISWEKECAWRMPVRVWQELMEHHFPNSAWVSLRRDVFDRLYSFKRERGLATWEETIDQLLPVPELAEVPA